MNAFAEPRPGALAGLRPGNLKALLAPKTRSCRSSLDPGSTSSPALSRTDRLSVIIPNVRWFHWRPVIAFRSVGERRSPGKARSRFVASGRHISREPKVVQYAPLLFRSGPASGEAIGTLQGEPPYHASLDPGEYRLLLGRNGFDVVARAAEDPDCGGHTVWLARRR